MNWIVNPMVTRSIVGRHTTWGSLNVRKNFLHLSCLYGHN
jgi:hypothetical protein